MTSGIIFGVCSTLTISVLQLVPKWCRKERKKNQVKKGSQRNQGQWWVLLQKPFQLFRLRPQKARGWKAMEIGVPGVRMLRNMIERCNPLWTVTQVMSKCTDSDFAGDLEDSKNTSGGTLCVFGNHTFVPINCLVVLFANSQYRSTYFFAWPSISWDHEEIQKFSEYGSFSDHPAEIRASNMAL